MSGEISALALEVAKIIAIPAFGLAAIGFLVNEFRRRIDDQAENLRESEIDRGRARKLLAAEDGAGHPAGRRARWRKAYEIGLGGLLDWADRPDRLGVRNGGALAARIGSHGWTARGYEFNLRLAFAYPIAAMLLVWLASGVDVSGITGLFPESTPGPERVLLALMFFLAAGFWFASIRASGWQSLVYYIVAMGMLAVAGASAGAVAFAGAFAGPFAGPFAGAFAGPFAGAFAVAGAGAFAGAVTVAVAVAVFFMQGWFEKRNRSGLFFCGHGLAFGALAIFLLPLLSPYIEPREAGLQFLSQLLIFLALFPLINALFDWLSLGLTRTLLRWALAAMQAGRAWLASLIGLGDLAVALLFLLALAMTATALLQVMNNAMPAQFQDAGFDLPKVFEDFCQPGIAWKYSWIYFTLFSTLAPTLMHVAAGGFALVLQGGGETKRRKFIALLDTNFGDSREDRMACARYLVFRRFLGALLTLLVFLGLAAIVTVVLPGFGEGIVAACRWVANLLDGDIPAC